MRYQGKKIGMSMIRSMNDWNRSLLSAPFVGGSAVIMAAWSSGMILPLGGRGPRFDSGSSPCIRHIILRERSGWTAEMR